MQATSKVLMIRPVNFGYNSQTAESNAFQKKPETTELVHQNALKEFEALVDLLQKNGVEVTVIQDTPEPHTADSIFPNNWISTHDSGQVFLYPMQAENRRRERKREAIETIKNNFAVREIIDLSYFEKENKFLEGTGSMVLDRENKVAYACISPRTNIEVLNRFSELSGYRIISFHAFDKEGKAIYHTNVLMCIGQKFSVICTASITNRQEREAVIKCIADSGKEIIKISFEEMNGFAGNMLQLKNNKDQDLLVMSEHAYQALTGEQIQTLSTFCKILHSPLYTIESNGGGSARCMIAEIFLECK